MRTSWKQFEIMVEFMERNGDLAKSTNGSRYWAAKKWRELTMRLNSDREAESRSVDKWRKVWADYKNNTKRKVARVNRATSATEGASAFKLSLTDLELRVVAIMGKQSATGSTNLKENSCEPVIHIKQEVELEPIEVANIKVEDSNSIVNDDHNPLPSPSTSQESCQNTPVATKRKWIPSHTKIRDKKFKVFLDAERKRDKLYFELEKERIRQRDVELELQQKWILLFNEALSVVKKFFEK